MIHAGYSGTPLWKKLGYKAGLTAFVHQAPANYVAMLDLPRDVPVTWAPKFKAGVPFVHLFVTGFAELGIRLTKYRDAIAPDGAVWVSWPKKSAGVPTDITEDRIRAAALPLGFVDRRGRHLVRPEVRDPEGTALNLRREFVAISSPLDANSPATPEMCYTASSLPRP